MIKKIINYLLSKKDNNKDKNDEKPKFRTSADIPYEILKTRCSDEDIQKIRQIEQEALEGKHPYVICEGTLCVVPEDTMYELGFKVGQHVTYKQQVRILKTNLKNIQERMNATIQ